MKIRRPGEHVSTIRSIEHDLSVRIETGEKHHMGARAVLIKLSRRIAGASRFRTTNGDAFFTPRGDGLFIHDECAILFADLRTGKFHHLEPTAGWYFTRVRIEGDSLSAQMRDTKGNQMAMSPIPIHELKAAFEPGKGAVSWFGRFPSAYP